MPRGTSYSVWSSCAEMSPSAVFICIPLKQSRSEMISVHVYTCCPTRHVTLLFLTHAAAVTGNTVCTSMQLPTCLHLEARAAGAVRLVPPQEKLTCWHSNNTQREQSSAVVEGRRVKEGLQNRLWKASLMATGGLNTSFESNAHSKEVDYSRIRAESINCNKFTALKDELTKNFSTDKCIYIQCWKQLKVKLKKLWIISSGKTMVDVNKQSLHRDAA